MIYPEINDFTQQPMATNPLISCTYRKYKNIFCYLPVYSEASWMMRQIQYYARSSVPTWVTLFCQVISTEMGERLANECKTMFCELSAKTGEQLSACVHRLGR